MSGWVTEGVKNSPSSGTVLADTGALSGVGGYNIRPIILAANVSAEVELQHRDSTNSSNVWSQRFWLGATNPGGIDSSLPFQLASNERLRIVTTSLTLGSVQASFYYE